MAKGEKINIPSWAQGAIAVSLVAGAGIVIYMVYRKVKQEKMLEGAKRESDSIDSELKKAGTPSLPASQIQQIANGLFTAMNGYGTDIPAIYREVSKLKNNADVLALKKAYGIREVSSGQWNPSGNLKGTLSQSFVDELETSQLNAINSLLAKKGITQRF